MLDRRDQPAGIKSEFVDEVNAPKLQSQTIFENFAQALLRRPAVTYTRRNGINMLDGNTFRQTRKTEAIALRADERPANRTRARLRCSAQFRAIARGFGAISFPPPGAASRAKWGGSTLGFEIPKHSPGRARRVRPNRYYGHARVLLNKLAKENADAATRKAAPANVASCGRIKPAIRDARASARPGIQAAP
jgi:hypothetical protein